MSVFNRDKPQAGTGHSQPAGTRAHTGIRVIFLNADGSRVQRPVGQHRNAQQSVLARILNRRKS